MFMLLLLVSQTAEQHTSDATTTTTTAAAAWTVNIKGLERRFRKRVAHTRLQGKRAIVTLETLP